MISAIRPGAPRFREPDEPRFKPCEGTLPYDGEVDISAENGWADVPFAIDVHWERAADGEVFWGIHREMVIGEKKFSGDYAPHNTSLEARTYHAVCRAIRAEHSTRIEERCAEEAARDG